MKGKPPTTGVTIAEIAQVEDLHPVYLRVLTRAKSFPEPVRKIGSNKIYDWREVDKFFRDRAKKKAA